MTKYPTYFDEDIRQLPNSDYLLQTHESMEQALGVALPQTFPLSLSLLDANRKQKGVFAWLSDLAGDTSQELILPQDPRNEAVYWLLFASHKPHRLEYSILARITDKPQVLLGIQNHPHIDDIAKELRQAYDTTRASRMKKGLQVPIRDYTPLTSFSRRPFPVFFNVIYPQNGTDLAGDFEGILEKHSALEELYEKGFKKAQSFEEEVALEFFF